MPRHLFGTDGVRGVAGGLLTAELALALGRAATAAAPVAAPRVLVIRDTRESGEMLEAALAAGIASEGGEVLLGGVLPTPAAPLLLRRHGLDLAVVLSASHNPYHDNGIKFFGRDGHKLTDATEEAIEACLDVSDRTADTRIGRVHGLPGTFDDYLAALAERFGDLDLSDLDIVLDCAHGATYRAAPAIFERLGATVTALHVTPNGRNINDGCGSTHVDRLAEVVRAGNHDLGFAFDGDGDRVLAADRNGVVVDGDELIALAALHLRRAGRLPGNGVVVTVMTNYGFHAAMAEHGVEVATTGVGDRYVLQAMRERAFALGGEQSGHMIEMSFNPTGDGIAGALLTLEALAGEDLAARHAMRKLPQRLVNVPVADREAAMGSAAVVTAARREEEALDGRGRVLVRPSGTEQLVRVMVEAPTAEEADAVCARLVGVVRAAE